MFSFNKVNKASKTLLELEELLIRTVKPFEIISLANEIEVFCSSVFGKDSEYTTHIRTIIFNPHPKMSTLPDHLRKEYALKGRDNLLAYIPIIKIYLSYKKKFPTPLPFTEKMKPLWFFKNASISVWSIVFVLLSSSYGVGIRYPQLGNTLSAIFSARSVEPMSRPNTGNTPSSLTKSLAKNSKQPPKLRDEVISQSNKTLVNQ